MGARAADGIRRVIGGAWRRAAPLLCAMLAISTPGDADEPAILWSANATGWLASISTAGAIDLAGPFFKSFGSNGRACSSCHQPASAWTLTPADVQARFEATGGTDPVFRSNDGTNSPYADTSTVEARRIAYALLLSKALIRIGIGVDNNAEFELAGVDDPYGFASAGQLSLFRRPLPSTNLQFQTAVMWDGRETFTQRLSPDCYYGTFTCFSNLRFNLRNQADGATLGHAEASHIPLPFARDTIIAFESSLFSAQAFDSAAGDLEANGASGGPLALMQQRFYFGMNDTSHGDYRTERPFDPVAFTIYDAWVAITATDSDRAFDDQRDARQSIHRGQQIFNQRPLHMILVKGLNDDMNRPVIEGTCTTCHNAPNVGTASVPAYFDIGVSDGSKRTDDLPLYTLRNKTTGVLIDTTDPGRALVSGRWRDIGRFKPPSLRALAARPPYFHNGSAADLNAVVDFYNERFGMDMHDDEKADLVAFLRAL